MSYAQPYSRDRTQEFQSIWKTLKKSSSSLSSSSSSSPLRLQSEFNKRAYKISFKIHLTSQKLAKLAELAKRSSSVFDDPTREIQMLSEVIKQDITALNSDVLDLQRLCNTQNGSWNVSDDASSHSAAVVYICKNRLMTATKECEKVLNKRTEKLKADETRRQLYRPHASTEFTNPFARQPPLATKSAASEFLAPPPPPWVNGASSSSTQFSSKQADGESQPLLQQQGQQQQQMVPLQDTYMQSRAESLQNFESTTHELSNIFTQLATMVSQQGEVAIRIDEDMERTLANVDGAQNQLVRYLNSISSNGWLTIKIFFVLIIFLMFFLVFIA
ncbi:syntaxin-32-like [Silene latifolia]|uniref:syntaxin-32-like n=1 Tax=Silene latifolia TaxID=37657 RepID=UPI003D77B343